MVSVPFSISNAHRGASDMRGTVRVEGDELVIEMQVKVFNLFKKAPQTFRFELTDLEEVRHTRRVWGDTVVLRTQPMDRVAAIPGSSSGELHLKVRRRDRPHLDTLLERIDLWIL